MNTLNDSNTESKSQVPAIPMQDIESLISLFLSSQDVRESSKVSYGKYLKGFLYWLREEGITKPIEEDLLAYRNYLYSHSYTKNGRERKLSPFTISEYIVAVRKFFKWTAKKGKYPNIAIDLKGAKKPSGFQRDYLILDLYLELLEAIDVGHLKGIRDYAIINLMVRASLRDIEVIRANVEDMRPRGDNIILYIQGKGKDSKDLPKTLKPDCYKPIQAYLNARGRVKDSDPIFVSLSNRNKEQRLTTKSISRIVKDRLRDIGIDSDKLTAHSLRHTGITYCLLGGATIQEAQSFAGHKDINTTLQYAHNIDRLKGIPETKIDLYIRGQCE